MALRSTDRKIMNPVRIWSEWDAQELADNFQKIDAHDHSHGSGELMDPWWSTRGMSAVEIVLEEYCAQNPDKLFEFIPWLDCPECEQRHLPSDDYLCFRCRN